MSPRKNKTFPVFLWHRRLGLPALVFMIILSITGVMLNHTEFLSLDEQILDHDWLLDWYGLNPQSTPRSFRADSHVITQWDEQIFFDRRPLMNSDDNLRGVATLERMLALALPQTIVLLNKSGDRIERIDTQSEFAEIDQLTTDHNRLIIKTLDGRLYRSDEQIIRWQPVDNGTYNWSTVVSTDDAFKQDLLKQYRGRGLTLERIILDLHSGRIFSAHWGVYLMDASAIVLLWLALSGLWVWILRRRKMKTKKHYRKHHRLS